MSRYIYIYIYTGILKGGCPRWGILIFPMVVYDSVTVPLGSLRNPTFPSYPMPLDPPFIQEAHDIETNNNKQHKNNFN